MSTTMEQMDCVAGAAPNECVVVWEGSQGAELRGSLLRAERHSAVFEVYNPSLLLHASEVLNSFRISTGEGMVYSGRAVLTSVIHSGTFLACEAALEDAWLDVDFTAGAGKTLVDDFNRFMRVSQGSFRVSPEFKIAIADIQHLLTDLRNWLEQVELQIRAQPAGNRFETERERLGVLAQPILETLSMAFQRFEEHIPAIDPALRSCHSAYLKRQLHPLVLCAPFMYRTYAKPLGYAGDYEMVNMMLRDPWEGATLFAKVLNAFFLSTPPVVAHRNRVKYLVGMLINEALRIQLRGKRALRVFNLGCGPAKEVADFIARSELSEHAQFTLLDLSEEALSFARQSLEEAKQKHHRGTGIQTLKKSVGQFIKETLKPNFRTQFGAYDVVYCAGLFDYLPGNVCRKLVEIGRGMLAPGGLMLCSNVAGSHASRGWMEYAVDWHLVYRDNQAMARLAPEGAGPDEAVVKAEESGVNYLLEVRKPSDV